MIWTIAGVALAALAGVFAWLAWRDARPYEPFEVTGISNGVFGLRRTGNAPAVVERVWIPHWAELHLASESARHGPFKVRRGECLYFALPDDAQPGVDITVEWRSTRIFRRARYWSTHLLAA